MGQEHTTMIARRTFLAGSAAAGLLALPGCASLGGYSLVDVVRRLLMASADNAFAKLTVPGGFWDSAVARFELPTLFGNRGGVVQSILMSDLFREKLQRQLNHFAEDGARRAAPVVTDAVRTIGVDNAAAILAGGPTAATTMLRSQMGPALINAMIPALSDTLRVANDPIVAQAITALAGVNLGDVAQAIANRADNSIWYQIGAEESAIRQNPASVRDAVLSKALMGV